MQRFTDDLAFRGLVHQVSDPTLFERLDHEPVTLYAGFDPTASSLHVGSLLPLCNLKRFQENGHRPIVLAGGGTGLVGDPGGKSEERPMLDREELEANLLAIRPQLERFLDFSPGAGSAKAEFANNADWLSEYSLLGFLRDIGKHFTVNQMIAKESVKSRLARPDQGISFTEFSYMLLQAADFLHLYDRFGCRLQLGGSDQWGNITMGVELIRKVRGETAFGLTSPLVLKADGSKFGKTESGTVFLDAKRTSPYAFYQYFFRVDDAVVRSYLRFFTFLEHEEIAALDEATISHPEKREAQRRLATEICRFVHGEEETRRVEHAAAALYSENLVTLDEATLLMVLDDAPSSTYPRDVLDGAGLDVVDALVESGLTSSKSAARTAISQGGAYVNNVRTAPDHASITSEMLIAGKYVVLRRGRRDLHLLCFR